MSLNKTIIALAFALALTACSKTEDAAETAADAATEATDAAAVAVDAAADATADAAVAADAAVDAAAAPAADAAAVATDAAAEATDAAAAATRRRRESLRCAAAISPDAPCRTSTSPCGEPPACNSSSSTFRGAGTASGRRPPAAPCPARRLTPPRDPPCRSRS